MEDRIPAFESVDDVMTGVYRDIKPEKRLEIALGMWLSARQMLTEAIRSFHPDWTEDQVERTVAERMLRREGAQGDPGRAPRRDPQVGE